MKNKMKAVIFHGIGEISIEEIDVPTIQKASDAIIRITLTTICGSDLHLIHGQTVVDPESPIGHECVGVVEEVGSDVSSFKPGDRVIVPTFTHCGNCFFCKKGSTSQCEKGGIVGFGSIRGGLGGAQTEYVRIPFADMSLVKTPDSLTDEDVLFVGDVIATAYFALENVPINPGDTVAIVGPGPVGLASRIPSDSRNWQPRRYEHARSPPSGPIRSQTGGLVAQRSGKLGPGSRAHCPPESQR